jgi:hypothetical protein
MDGDGCITMYKEHPGRGGNGERFELSIGLHIKDIKLLYFIKELLNCGIVRKYNNVCYFRIKKIKHLLDMILIFDKYPFLTESKRIKYLE